MCGHILSGYNIRVVDIQQYSDYCINIIIDITSFEPTFYSKFLKPSVSFNRS